jgi:hypothetical protein
MNALTTIDNDLAPRIIREHEAAREHGRQAIEHAVAAGDLLIEAKGKVPKGQWLDWVNENCHFSERTAQAYMRLAEQKEVLRSSAADSIRNALEVVAKPRRITDQAIDADYKEVDEKKEVQPASPPDDDLASWDEERIAESIARDVENEIASWKEEGRDLDLIRELVLQKLKFEPTSEVPAEPVKEIAEAPKSDEQSAPPKPSKRGRPSKNKPKEESAPAAGDGAENEPVTGNSGDPTAEGEEQKAKNAALLPDDAEPPKPAPAAAGPYTIPPDLSMPEFMRRSAP